MNICILTDIPVWVRPLARALSDAGVDCQVATKIDDVPEDGLIVNRISALLIGSDPQRAHAFGGALQDWERLGRRVVNGSTCYRIGLSKWQQFQHFQDCDVATPLTRVAIPGRRSIPDRPVLIKPPGGGYGKGILALEPGQPAPAGLFSEKDGWIEQEVVTPADGWVHRVEFLGDEILYEARSPHQPDDFNYCLAKVGDQVEFVVPGDLPPAIASSALQVAGRGGLALGAVEYFVNQQGLPVFFDFNPVSSIPPQAESVLRSDPWKRIAESLINGRCG